MTKSLRKSKGNHSKLIFTAVILVSFLSYAETAKNSESKSGIVSSSSAPNIQNSANTSQKQNNSAGTLSKVIGVANMGLGAVKMSQFAASCSGGATCQYGLLAQGILHFAMGAQSFQQAKQHAGSAYGSALTGLDTSAWNNPFGDPNSNTGGLSTGDSGADKDLAAIVNTGKFNDIKNKLLTSGIGGVRLDPKTGKIFDKNTGKSYDSAALTDSKAMADAGFSAGDIAAAMAGTSKAEKAAMKKLGLTEGIGAATAENGYSEGGSTGSISSAASVDYGMGGRGIASSGGGVKIPSNQIAGLTKNFNGERIGVPAENIFNMMTRRYKTKEKQNSFFDPSELVKMPQ